MILILMSIDKFLTRWVGVAMDGNMTLTISTGLEKLQWQIVVVNHCYQIDHDHVRLWWWSWYKVLAHSSEPWYKNMTMPIIVMTKTLIRSAVTDNDWVCQMDWVPALSQVNRLPHSIYFFDFEFVLVSLCFMTNPKNQKYEEEKKAGKSAGGWCLRC